MCIRDSQDDVNFEQHWSVAYWRRHTTRYHSEVAAEELSDQDRLRSYVHNAAQAVSIQTAGATTATDAAYWAYHLFRLSWFAAVSAAGMAVVVTQEGPKGLSKSMETLSFHGFGRFVMVCATLCCAVICCADVTCATLSRAANTATCNGCAHALQGVTSEALYTFKADLRCVNEGVYRLPWDMTTPSHRQFNPLWASGEAARTWAEARRIVGRVLGSQGAVITSSFTHTKSDSDHITTHTEHMHESH